MQTQATAIWTKACKYLGETLSKDVYDRWISVIEAKSLSEDQLLLNVANDLYHSWLEENYLPLIQSAIVSACGRDLQVKIAVDPNKLSTPRSPDQPSSTSQPAAVPEVKTARTANEPNLNHKYTFDTFVVGASNNFAHAAALAVAQSPARAYNPLFIYGGVGLGKTHLMQAIGHEVMSKAKHKICYTSSEVFTNDYINALQKQQLVQFRIRLSEFQLIR